MQWSRPVEMPGFFIFQKSILKTASPGLAFPSSLKEGNIHNISSILIDQECGML
jgi:hypothetical protein